PPGTVGGLPGTGQEAIVLAAPYGLANRRNGGREHVGHGVLRSSDSGRDLARLAKLNRLDDVVIARATANVAFQTFANLLFGSLRLVLQDLHGRHDHAGGPEAALQAVAFAERRLHRMQLAILAEPLDPRDLAALRLHREHRTRLHGAAVQLHRA